MVGAIQKFSSLLLVLCVGSAFGGIDTRSQINRQKMEREDFTTVNVDEITLDTTYWDNKHYALPKLDGIDNYLGVTSKIGWAELPVIRFYIKGQASITLAKKKKNTRLEKNVRIYPVQPPRVKLPNVFNPFAMDESFYQKDQLYPVSPFEITDAGSIRGEPVKLVSLYPVQYNPLKGELIQNLGYEVRSTSKLRRRSPNPDGFLWIVGPTFKNSPALESYRKFKTALGYQVDILQIESGTNETADTLRTKIQTWYRESGGKAKYVLIVGDDNEVPAKRSSIISGSTDHYYRAIDTDDYASDIDGPDLGVGRFSVRTELELETVLSKNLKYESGDFQDDSLLKKAAFLATNDGGFWEVAEGTHNHVIGTYTSSLGLVGVFPDNPAVGGDRLYKITHNVSDEKTKEILNSGRVLINYSGHGSNTLWDSPSFNQADVRAMPNTGIYPFVISNACNTGNFQVTEAFAETWQRSPNGSVLFWGSVDSSYWDEDDILERAFYEGIFSEGKTKISDMTDFALLKLWAHFGGNTQSKYYWETYTVFGDPTLRIRYQRPEQLTLEGPMAVPIGTQSVKYQALNSLGLPVSGVRVSLNKTETSLKRSLQVSETDSAGEVEIDLSAVNNDVGKFQLVASGTNTKIQESELVLISPEASYIQLANFLVNNEAKNSLALGETVSVGVTLKNLGKTKTKGGKITLERIDGPATILKSQVNFPELEPQAVYQIPENSLKIQVDQEANANEIVKLNYKWETVEGDSGVTKNLFRTRRAQIIVSEVTTENQGVGPGDIGELNITLSNEGNEWIKAGELTAYAEGCVSSISGNYQNIELEPGGFLTLSPKTKVHISPNCVNGSEVSFGFVGDYFNGVQKVSLQSQSTFVAGVVSSVNKELADLQIPIPDKSPVPVVQPIQIDSAGKLTAVGVHIKLKHSFLSDLSIRLVHPSGKEISLFNREWGDTNDLDQLFGLTGKEVKALATLEGLPMEGEWKVLVQDHALSDVGTLESVKLILQGYLQNRPKNIVTPQPWVG